MVDMKEALTEAAKSALESAYAPYSGFRVGAAVLSPSGRIYTGCNVENASYGLSICAERVAVMNAVCAGERSLIAAAIASESGEYAFPCGACRQVLAEFAEEPFPIYLAAGERVEEHTLAELLPHTFKFDRKV